MPANIIAKMTKIFATSLALAGTVVFTIPAQATDLWCGTKIGTYGVDNGGNLWIGMDANNGGKWTMICNLYATTNNGVNGETCKGMMSTVLTAKALGKTVTLHLLDSGSYASCSDMPIQWNSAISSVWTASD
jgi:hypothetical protein